MNTRPRSCAERERWKISWMTLWPGRSAGWALPAKIDLERPIRVPQQPREPIHVGEQECRALVGREPAGEADGHDRRVERGVGFGQDRRRLAVPGELAAQPTVDEDRELALLAEMRLPEVRARDAVEPLPEAVLAAAGVERAQVGVEVPREQLVDRGTHPGRTVDTVRDRLDLVVDDVLPGGVGGLGVQLADRIRAVGQAQAEGRHVELAGIAVRAHAQLQDVVDGHATRVEQRAGDAPDELGVEPLVARRDRRVDREHAVAPDPWPRVVQLGAGGDVFARSFGQQERRVALVEMPDRRRQRERPDRPDAADAEDELLVQPHLATADVEDVRDRPVLDGVLGDVGVEQQDRHAADLGKPDRHGQVAPGKLDPDGQRQAVLVLDARERQAREVVVGVVVLLVAVRVDRLAEVALPIEQPDAEERQRHVAGRLHVVAGEDPEAARVDAERLVDAVLGAEIRDRTVELVAVPALEPVPRAVGHVAIELGQDVLVFGEELLVVEEAGPLRRTADDRDRVAIAVPGRPVDEAPQVAGPRIPCPAEVVGEAPEAFETGWQREAGRRDRRDSDGVHARA